MHLTAHKNHSPLFLTVVKPRISHDSIHKVTSVESLSFRSHSSKRLAAQMFVMFVMSVAFYALMTHSSSHSRTLYVP